VPTKRANTVPVHERKITPSIRLAAAGLFGGFSDAAHAVLQIAADIDGVEFSCVDNAACDTSLHEVERNLI
jgi:hypothetical protein